jgi:YHS domain-containing protein
MVTFGQARNTKPKPQKVRDPVCGILVDKDPRLSAEYKGTTYYFCSIADREKFKKSPETYIKTR